MKLSVRARITAAAMVIVTLVLSLASWALLELVRDDLIAGAEDTIDEVVEQATEGVNAAVTVDGTFFEVDTLAGPLAVSILGQERGLLVADLYTPDLTQSLGLLFIDPETADIVEAVDFETGLPLAPELLPVDLSEATEANFGFDADELINLPADPLEEVQRNVDSVRDALLVTVPAVVVVLGVATWLMVGRALRPVHAITEQVGSITASTMDARVPVPQAKDEVAELATMVNGMLDRLEAGSERQRQFVADASHELRSPLATIRAATEVGLANAAEDVFAECDRMDALIGDLLDLARLDEQRPAADAGDVDVAAVARAVVERRPDADPKVSVETIGPTVVRGVERQLEGLVTNLVENGARHARGAVAVAVERRGVDVVLTVEDDGPGIASTDRERVFERFVRLDSARARTDGGAGLGLALARAVVERHAGSVRVDESPRLGGARFTVRLPAAVSSPVIANG